MQKLLTLVAGLLVLGTTELAGSKAAPAITITGEKKAGVNQWTIPGDSTANKPGKIGEPAGRMQVPVAKGDIVAFVVKSGQHHVLFEKAKSEQEAGVWEVVKDSGSLVELPTDKFPHYDHKEARMSKADSDNLIKIRILKLDKGKSILFGCYPHSESTDGTKVPMLGVLVLKEAKKGTRGGKPRP
jgi:hypothetical protein